MLKIAGADPIALHAVFVQHVGLAFQIKGQTLACLRELGLNCFSLPHGVASLPFVK